MFRRPTDPTSGCVTGRPRRGTPATHRDPALRGNHRDLAFRLPLPNRPPMAL